MAAKKRTGLGKGVEALIKKPIENNAELLKPAEGEAIVKVDISKVEPNPKQPRKTFSEESLNELAASIKQQGIIDPLVVTNEGDHYEIVAGERRWRSAMKVGLTEVPVVIREYTELQKMQIAIIDNLQREDLNDIDKALYYNRFLTEMNYTQEQVAEMVNKSRSSVANVVRLLNLEEEVQQMIIDKKITSGHARALLVIEDPKKQVEIAHRVVDEQLNVRDIERLVKEPDKKKPEKKKKDDPQFLHVFYKDVENNLREKYSAKVSIIPKDEKKGKIEFEYNSREELDALIEMLQSAVR